MIDVSDGLATDVAKLCAESDCGAVLWAEGVPISDAARAMKDGKSPLEHALGDGEDFELAFAVRPDEGERLVREQPVPGVTLAKVGECVAARGLWLEEKGQRREIAALGWVHEMG
jgi:thiamine-monophosphate kinase